MKMAKGCDLRGYLGFLVLWTLSKNQSITGVDIANELEKRKGCKPNPGTIYPVLKDLKNKGLIKDTNGESFYRKYSLTEKGHDELKRCRTEMAKIFYDFHEIVA